MFQAWGERGRRVGAVLGALTGLACGERGTASGDFAEARQGLTADVKLVAAERAANDQFGGAVWISGDRALVGMPGADSKRGAAYVFERQPDGSWSAGVKVVAASSVADDQFGSAVALDGSRALIGATGDQSDLGAAFVFERQANGTWSEVGKLVASDPEAGDGFGSAVALSGDRALVGAPSDNTTLGEAYLFERQSDGSWTQVARIWEQPRSYAHNFGRTVSLSGDRALIGTSQYSESGSAYVYDRGSDGVWARSATLQGTSNESFAFSIALEGERALIGAYNRSNGGQAYVYNRDSGGTWTRVATLASADGEEFDDFGWSVALSGDRALVGARAADGFFGASYVFERQAGGAWTQLAKILASDGAKNDMFGLAVSLSGTRALIGAPRDDSSRGSAYVVDVTDGDPLGAACSSAATCRSGYCADGVCCETPCEGDYFACVEAVTGLADGTCALWPLATACTVAQQCASGFCSDGICCNAACDTANDSCLEVLTGLPDGTCGKTATGNPCTAGGACATGFCSDGVCCDVACDTVNDSCVEVLTGLPDGTCALAMAGVACTSDARCASEHCVDGVCCESDCATVCMACATEKTGASDGTCAPVLGDTDPDDDCDPVGSGVCQTPGVCDGDGACASRAGTVCLPAECSSTGAALTLANVCDTDGSCNPQGTVDCQGFVCRDGACLATCTSAADCAGSRQCVGGSCGEGRGLGATCTGDDECGSGYCVEEVCCNEACDQACESCLGARKASGGENGICGPTASTVKDSRCPVEGGCGANGACDGLGACRPFAPSGTQCGVTVCAGTASVAGDVCDGAGECISSSGESCGAYICADSVGACLDSCGNDAECTSGHFCSAGACVSQHPNGALCASAAECSAGFCVDGVCCNEACDVGCRSCSKALNEQGQDGMCGVVRAGELDPRGECAKDLENPCGTDGRCDDSGQCRLVPQGDPCGASTCTEAVAVTRACDGFGACTEHRAPCAPYACDAAGATCGASCDTTADCAAGAVCEVASGQCASADTTCVDPFTVELPDGATASCAPYTCEAGACRESCDRAADCAEGYDCVDRACAAIEQPAGTGGAGGDGTSGAADAGATGAPDDGAAGDGAAGEEGGAPSAGAAGTRNGATARDGEDSHGCGCRTAGAPSRSLPLAAYALAAATVLARGRRRRRE